MIVVDASIVVRLLLNREQDAPLRERISRKDTLHAPALIDAEVASAVRGLLRANPAVGMSLERAEEMLRDFSGLPIARYPMLPFLRDALSLRENFTVYDALYLVLARALDGQLLTADTKFAKALTSSTRIETWA